MTTDCSLFMKIVSSEYPQSTLCTQNVLQMLRASEKDLPVLKVKKKLPFSIQSHFENTPENHFSMTFAPLRNVCISIHTYSTIRKCFIKQAIQIHSDKKWSLMQWFAM